MGRFVVRPHVLAHLASASLVVGLASCSQKLPEPNDAAPPIAEAGPASDAAASLDAGPAADSGSPPSAQDAGTALLAPSPARDGMTALREYHRVLHIGDSMVGFKFGLTRALGGRFEKEGAHFFSIPVTSAGIQSFEKNTDLDDAIKKTRPDLVLLTLGANNATSPSPEYLVPSIKRVVKKVGVGPGRRCFWIGPPLWKPDKVGFVDVLAKATAPCTFFDSSKLVLERMSDGIHPTNKGGEVWAEAFYAFLLDELSRDPPETHVAANTASNVPNRGSGSKTTDRQ